ncbi:MAG: hypothetical protein EBU90_16455 [Proteobacteria bacterium]|nr:hypothetical protein [Pseudomonadota bacterium]NBP14348.1 hypothetical protein [bacterium]
MRSIVFLLLLCFFHAQSISAMKRVCSWFGFSSKEQAQPLAVDASASDAAAAEAEAEGYQVVGSGSSAETSDNDTIVPGGQDQQPQLLPIEALSAAENSAHQPAVAVPSHEPEKLTYAQVVALANRQ